jgi:hypothetical protein
MQSFVPDFDCDLFISSARADVSLSAENGEIDTDWAKELAHGLAALLAQKLGRRDGGVVAGPSISDQPIASELIHRSAALLVVLNREYALDTACLAELNAFLSLLGDDDPISRVFVALADDIDRESWPAALQGHLAFDFLTPPDPAEPGLAANRRRLAVSDKLYPVRLDDLSTEVALCLERLKGDPQAKLRAEAPTVFLGTASPDVVDLRDSMRRYLIQEGFRIVPNRWYPQSLAAFREAVLNDMRNSQLLVQILGSLPCLRTTDSSTSLGQVEIELAGDAGLPILCWRDPRLDLNSVADADHRRLLEGQHVLAVGIEEFKRKAVERAHTHSARPAEASSKPLVVVAASEVDRPLARQVGELLGGKGLGIEIPDTEEFPWERYSNGKHGVGGLVIVYGACPAIWVRQQLWKYRKAMARTESRPPLCAVCEGPPQVKEPLRYDVPQMDTIDCRVELTETALSSFIEAVQRRCSQ